MLSLIAIGVSVAVPVFSTVNLFRLFGIITALSIIFNIKFDFSDKISLIVLQETTAMISL